MQSWARVHGSSGWVPVGLVVGAGGDIGSSGCYCRVVQMIGSLQGGSDLWYIQLKIILPSPHNHFAAIFLQCHVFHSYIGYHLNLAQHS